MFNNYRYLLDALIVEEESYISRSKFLQTGLETQCNDIIAKIFQRGELKGPEGDDVIGILSLK
jgi:hypothetical protein